MLAGRSPARSVLSRNVPEDFYLIEFRSLARLLELIEVGDLWGTQLNSAATHDARTRGVGERLRGQLAVDAGPLAKALGDGMVQEVALTGSDLLLGEGSDVTLLFRYKGGAFKPFMDKSLAAVAKARPDARRGVGKYLGVEYVHLGTPGRELHVFSAYPGPGLHVRNSLTVTDFGEGCAFEQANRCRGRKNGHDPPVCKTVNDGGGP